MRNARLDELQAGIKIRGRNVNSLRYGDDTTLPGGKFLAGQVVYIQVLGELK